ncbi:hypothetical protein CAJAP_01646 [Camponotus japonicus]
MSRQLRGERDHVSRDYQEGYLGDFRDLRDLRDFRDFHRDPLGDIRDDRDSQGLREGPGRTYRDDYPEEYDHRPTVASTSANLTNNPKILLMPISDGQSPVASIILLRCYAASACRIAVTPSARDHSRESRASFNRYR